MEDMGDIYHIGQQVFIFRCHKNLPPNMTATDSRSF